MYEVDYTRPAEMTLSGVTPTGEKWEMEIVNALPHCHLCEVTPTNDNPMAAWKLHSGSPVCESCVKKYS